MNNEISRISSRIEDKVVELIAWNTVCIRLYGAMIGGVLYWIVGKVFMFWYSNTSIVLKDKMIENLAMWVLVACIFAGSVAAGKMSKICKRIWLRDHRRKG